MIGYIFCTLKEQYTILSGYFWTLVHLEQTTERHIQDSNRLVTELLKRVVECVNNHVNDCTQRIIDAIGHIHLGTQHKTMEQLQDEMGDLITSINMANGKVAKLSETVNMMRDGVTGAMADLNTIHHRRNCR